MLSKSCRVISWLQNLATTDNSVRKCFVLPGYLFYCHMLSEEYEERVRVREGVFNVHAYQCFCTDKIFRHVILCMSTNSLLWALTQKYLLMGVMEVQQATKHLTSTINNVTPG